MVSVELHKKHIWLSVMKTKVTISQLPFSYAGVGSDISVAIRKPTLLCIKISNVNFSV